jgi:C-terminal processing protease CtpA/Prc
MLPTAFLFLALFPQGHSQASSVFYPLFHPFAPELALEVRAPDGARRKVRVAWMSSSERLAAQPAVEERDGPLWKLEFLDSDVGYLRMPSWVTYKTKWDWKADLRRTAEALVERQARALVVDLRGNEGGTDVGDELLRYLLETPLAAEPLERRTRYRAVPKELRAQLDTWDPGFFDWQDEAIELDDGWFALAPEDEATLTPLAPRFTGKLLVLIDSSNSSATFQFAQRVQRARLGTLIGEPTGGNQRGINGGAFFFLRLPESDLEVDVPLIGTFPEREVPDAGLTPDILVLPTAADIAAGRDPVLAAALARA